jgi:hypothetical protein
MAVARTQLAVMAGDVRQRAEAVVLHLEEPVGMVERLGDADEGHWAGWLGNHSSSVAARQYRCQAQPLASGRKVRDVVCV